MPPESNRCAANVHASGNGPRSEAPSVVALGRVVRPIPQNASHADAVRRFGEDTDQERGLTDRSSLG
jgi:hypothetical protein